MTDDPKISGRYRDLGREEPPRALDDAILAASRRAVEARPAPLVVPTGRRRWYFPLAAAAVIVLAVAVTVHVQREQPGEEMVTASRTEPPAAVLPPAPPQAAQERGEPEKPQPAPSRPRAFTPDPKPQPVPEQPAGAVADSRADSRELRAQRDAAPSAEPQAAGARELESARAAAPAAAMRRADEVARASPALAKLAQQSPEQWLLGIDDLKRQGKHDEAEKQLAEFRKRYPNYRIPESISEKFERR